MQTNKSCMQMNLRINVVAEFKMAIRIVLVKIRKK